MPCLSMERVSDIECIVERLLRSGANPNILPKPEDDCSEWLWVRIFRHTFYSHPLVLALILANADVCCTMPNYFRGKSQSNQAVTVIDFILCTCEGRLRRRRHIYGGLMLRCRNYDCFYKIIRSTIRCLELVAIAGAHITHSHIENIQYLIDTLSEYTNNSEALEDIETAYDAEDVQTSIDVLRKIINESFQPQTLLHLCRLCVRKCLRVYIDTSRTSHHILERVGLRFTDCFRKAYSPYKRYIRSQETFLQRLSSLSLPKALIHFVAFEELKESYDTFWYLTH